MYRCLFPNCNYSTNDKSLIEFHHITPRSVDRSKRNKLTISLCPTCHKLIYHPLAKSGQHANNTPKSIQILNLLDSNVGIAVSYLDYEGNKKTYFPHDGTIINY